QGIFLAANSLADEIFFSRTGSTWVEMLHKNNLPSTAITYSASQTFNSGISFGSGVAASATDLSRHIALWGSLYGISVTGNRLNLVAPTGASVYFVVNGVDVGRAGADGIHDTSGNVR